MFACECACVTDHAVVCPNGRTWAESGELGPGHNMTLKGGGWWLLNKDAGFHVC